MKVGRPAINKTAEPLNLSLIIVSWAGADLTAARDTIWKRDSFARRNLASDIPPQDSDARTLASLLEQAARRLHSQGYAANLFPAQWAALRYMRSAEPTQRTAIDLARFQGLASGAVARTVRTLISKGLLVKEGTVGRGRAERLGLTDRGQTVLRKDPLAAVVSVLETLDESDRRAVASALDKVINATRPISGNGQRRSGG